MLESILIAAVSLTAVALVLGVCIVLVSKKFHVYEDPLIDVISSMLPGANCGACGYPGCAQLAAVLVETKDPSKVCPANSAEANEQIGKALGIDLSGGKPVVCAVKCQGNSAVSKMTATYHGIEDCWAAMQTLHGTKVCPFSCIGLGSCVSACKYGALEIVDGMVAVDSDLCVGCGLCIKTCPVQVLELQDKWSWRYYVACNSKDKGAVTRKYCEVGCIGCKQCEKVCPADAVKVENFCAVIDQDTCVACGLCIEECPTKAIVLKHDAIKAKES